MSPQERFLCGLLLPIAAVTLAACPGSKDICAHHDCPSNYTCEWGFPDGCVREDGCAFIPTCVCLYGSKDQGGACVDACELDTWADKATYGCRSLPGAELAGIDLTGGVFYDAQMQGANLSGAILADSNLDSADLTGANLKNADLTDAYGAAATFNDANLSGANLTGAHLLDAHFEGADLTQVQWQHTTCPDGADSDAQGGTCCGNLGGATPGAGCD